MNGYSSVDLLGRTGKNLSVTVDGQRMLFRGEPAVPCVLKLNGTEAAPSQVVYAGDSIEFVPAVSGAPAQRTVKDLLGADFTGGVMVNDRLVDLEIRLNTGDQVVTSTRPIRPVPVPARREAAVPERQDAAPPKAVPPKTAPPQMAAPKAEAPHEEPVKEKTPRAEERSPVPPAPQPNPWEKPAAPAPAPRVIQPQLGPPLQVMLNGKALLLPGKPEGTPYYVMDLLEHSGIDFEHLDRGVELQVNGKECAFSQELRTQDEVIIRYLET